MKEFVEKLKDIIVEHRKIVLPVVLVAAIFITMYIGMTANRKNQEKEEVQVSAVPEQTETVQAGLTVPDVPLEENAYPEINELIMKYYKALEDVNTDALTEIMSPLTEDIVIRFTEWAKHVEACPAVNIYTKPGPREDSYLAYVRVDVKIVGYDETIPGLNSFFICKNDAGNYYINMEEEIDKEEADYIDTVNMQDDVVDLNNKISAEFNQLVPNDSDAAKAFMHVEDSIIKGIQEELTAQREEESAETTEETEEQPEEAQTQTVATEVKTTAVVNMRSSDSEKADKLGKAQIGDTFKVLEERANGWTKLTDGTQEFFIKSEFLETISEETVTVQETTEQETVQEETPAVNLSLGSSGYVTAKTTVNVRKGASETAERLGTIFMGEKLELIMNQADGWCKVKYKGQTAYVKSEFME
ncbi:MAG: SH3 domain-containing protein [Lachnospiraceae bacterium]|nr:SH3 domain-containing protein [Lachnospiraceae bacterium]